MNNQFTPDHEEILIFIEENISKLVRLKVASKAKYEAYDESLIDYLTDDSINDEERISLYSEQMLESYQSMLWKLLSAIKTNPELKNDVTVKAYFKLMTGETL